MPMPLPYLLYQGGVVPLKSSEYSDYVELTGVFAHRKFRSQDGNYCVCLYKVKRDFVTVVGSDLPEVEYPVTFSGNWITDPRYGEQFKVNQVLNQLPRTKRDIIAFIISTPADITHRQAESLVNKVGHNDFWNCLFDDPESLSSPTVPISMVLRLRAEVKRLTTHSDLQRLFGSDLELSNWQYQQICALFRDDPGKASDSIRENPYILIRAGYPFKKLDLFAKKKSSFSPNDYRRLLAAAQDVLLDAQAKSHVGFPVESMLSLLTSSLRPIKAVARDECKAFLREACKKQDLVFAHGLFYLPRAYEEETSITKKLAAMATLAPRSIDRKKFDQSIEQYGNEKGFTLSPDQQNAVWTAITRQICIITGGPGTGKSTILDAILYCWRIFHKNEKWLLMAPTGKASVRITETTGQSASTIHSTLDLVIDSNFDKMQELDVKIEHELTVVDESSMIDLSVAAALVGSLACAETGKQHLILVGDPEQLPSVGYGNVLADMISSEVVPVCSLNTIYRQAADNPIVTNSLRIRDDNADLLWANDFKRYHVGGDTDNKEAACKLFLRCVRQFGIENVALLSPFHNKTEISTNVLNRQLQESINPKEDRPEVKGPHVVFRVNDRVMQLRNTQWLSNGDVGTVVNVTPSAGSNEICLTVEFESGIIQDYRRDDLTQLDLAYAFSIHKSQGSQYKCVIIVLPNEPSSFLTRSILYTGITRAKAHIALIGPSDTIQYMIHNNKQDVRHTNLMPRLRKIIAAAA